MVAVADFVELPGELGPIDHLMHRCCMGSFRFRSAMMALELLDTTPDWQRFRSRFEHASRRILRLRQKIVAPTLPTAAPRWVVDPDFDLDFHVRRVRVPEPGSLRDVFDLAEVVMQSPLDLSRPLWTATLVEGLPNGKAVMLLLLSHTVADGMGAFSANGLFAPIYDFERDPPAEPELPLPVPQNMSSNDLMREGINHLPGAIVAGMRGAASVVGRAALNPWSAVAGAVGYARSAVRVARQPADPSPLLQRRSLATRSEVLDIRLSDLRKAAKVVGGSINDAYLAGLCGALGRYHQVLGASIETLPMGVPVSLRTEADAVGGNRYGGLNLAAPLSVADPVARMKEIRAQMARGRGEPALGLLGSVAPVLNILPSVLLQSTLLSPAIASDDVLASNVADYPGDTYIAGAAILRRYGLGSFNGAAMDVVLVSKGGSCTITARYDRAAVSHETLFAQCLQQGFNEILALAGESTPRAVPAAFDAGPSRSSSQLVSSS